MASEWRVPTWAEPVNELRAAAKKQSDDPSITIVHLEIPSNGIAWLQKSFSKPFDGETRTDIKIREGYGRIFNNILKEVNKNG